MSHVAACQRYVTVTVNLVGPGASWLHDWSVRAGAARTTVIVIGGELGQSRLGLPNALTGVFSGLLLFLLLACDTLINYRVRWQASRPAGAPVSVVAPKAAS